MATYQSSQTPSTPSVTDQKHQAQSEHWREIGIAAVAAATRPANAATPKSVENTGANAMPKRVVTLRDIDHLASC